jgi:hypothetical protein
VKDGKSSAEEGKTDKEAKAEDDKKADEETPTVKEDKKEAAKNKTTVVKAEVKVQTVYKDVSDPSEETIKQAKKL